MKMQRLLQLPRHPQQVESAGGSGRGRVSYQDFLDMLRAAAVNEGHRAHEAGLPPTPDTMPPLRAAVAHSQANLTAL